MSATPDSTLPAALERLPEPGAARHPAEPENRRALAGPPEMGPKPVLVQRPEGRAKADQCQERDRGAPANVPRRLPAAPVHPAGRRVLRVDGDVGWKAALFDCHEGSLPVRHRQRKPSVFGPLAHARRRGKVSGENVECICATCTIVGAPMRGNAVRYLAKSGGIEVNLESVE